MRKALVAPALLLGLLATASAAPAAAEGRRHPHREGYHAEHGAHRFAPGLGRRTLHGRVVRLGPGVILLRSGHGRPIPVAVTRHTRWHGVRYLRDLRRQERVVVWSRRGHGFPAALDGTRLGRPGPHRFLRPWPGGRPHHPDRRRH